MAGRPVGGGLVADAEALTGVAGRPDTRHVLLPNALAFRALADVLPRLQLCFSQRLSARFQGREAILLS